MSENIWETILGGVVAVVIGVGLIVLLAIPFGFILKIAWNSVMPQLFGLPVIGFWQSVALLIVSGMLIKK